MTKNTTFYCYYNSLSKPLVIEADDKDEAAKQAALLFGVGRKWWLVKVTKNKASLPPPKVALGIAN